MNEETIKIPNSLDFREVASITIPEGEVQEIQDAEGVVLWRKP